MIYFYRLHNDGSWDSYHELCIYHEKQFSEHDLKIMSKEAIEHLKNEEYCIICQDDVGEYLCKKYGFKTIEIYKSIGFDLNGNLLNQ